MTEELTAKPEEVLERYLPTITFDGDLDPAFRNLPVQVQGILLLRAMGLTPMEISKILKVENTVISGYLVRHDPYHKFRLTKEQVKQVQKAYWLRIQNLAFTSLDAERMSELDPNKVVRMADQAQKALDKLEQPGVSKLTATQILKRLMESKAVTVEVKDVNIGEVTP
jgi:hypothetical protein